MSAGVYTTTLDILGGTGGTDEWGDPLEGTEVLKSGVPAMVVERAQRVATEEDPQAVTVHYYVGRVPAGTPVNRDHRVRDRDGTLYSIDYVSHPADPTGQADIRLDLRRVT